MTLIPPGFMLTAATLARLLADHHAMEAMRQAQRGKEE
jgi:hypothetical protein